MTDNVTLEFGGRSSSDGERDAEHVWIVRHDGSPKTKVSSEAVPVSYTHLTLPTILLV